MTISSFKLVCHKVLDNFKASTPAFLEVSRFSFLKKTVFFFLQKHQQTFRADLVTFTEEILNGRLHFLCSAMSQILYPPPDISSLNIVLVLWPIEHVQKKEIGKSEIFSAKFC